jgi:hypothetical protein
MILFWHLHRGIKGNHEEPNQCFDRDSNRPSLKYEYKSEALPHEEAGFIVLFILELCSLRIVLKRINEINIVRHMFI